MKEERKRILVVDDEVSFTRLLKMNLENLSDYEVESINSASAAMEAALRFEPDLILLDVMMPGMDGGDLAGHLQEHPKLKGIPIVFLTAAVKQEELRDRAGLVGGFPFVAKPVDITELQSIIEKNLNPCH